MIKVSVNIDVPNLADGYRFYCAAFGFEKLSEPYPGVMLLKGGNVEVALLAKPAHSQPAAHTKDRRSYDRHWTPVHLDFLVDDFKKALATAVAAGAVQEQIFADTQHGSIAFCSDPFGNGFCVLEDLSQTK